MLMKIKFFFTSDVPDPRKSEIQDSGPSKPEIRVFIDKIKIVQTFKKELNVLKGLRALDSCHPMEMFFSEVIGSNWALEAGVKDHLPTLKIFRVIV